MIYNMSEDINKVGAYKLKANVRKQNIQNELWLAIFAKNNNDIFWICSRKKTIKQLVYQLLVKKMKDRKENQEQLNSYFVSIYTYPKLNVFPRDCETGTNS